MLLAPPRCAHREYFTDRNDKMMMSKYKYCVGSHSYPPKQTPTPKPNDHKYTLYSPLLLHSYYIMYSFSTLPLDMTASGCNFMHLDIKMVSKITIHKAKFHPVAA